MGKGSGLLDTIIEQGIAKTYLVYCLVGIILCIAGSVLLLSDDGSQVFISWGLAIVGLSMLFVGEAGVYAAYKKQWLIMTVVEICNIILVIVLMMMMMIGFVLASGTTDPNRAFWNTAYGPCAGNKEQCKNIAYDGEDVTDASLEAAVKFKKAQWNNNVCERKSDEVDSNDVSVTKKLTDGCKAFRTVQCLDKFMDSISGANTKACHSRLGEYFGNCTAIPVMRFLPNSACKANKISCQVAHKSEASCDNCVGDLCLDTECPVCAKSKATDCKGAMQGTRSKEISACVKCVEACKESTITLAEDNMEVVTIVSFATFFFVLFNLFFNNVLLTKEDWNGLWGQLGMIINGLVVLISLMLFGFGISTLVSANDVKVCPTQDCVSTDVWLALLIGFGLMAASGVAVGSVYTNFKMGVRVVNMVYAVLAFFLLIVALLLAIVSGLMDDINQGYDDNFNQLRIETNQKYRQSGEGECAADKMVCPGTGPVKDRAACTVAQKVYSVACEAALPCPTTEINKLPVSNGCKIIAKEGNQSDNAYWQAVVCPYGGADWKLYQAADKIDTKTCKESMNTEMRGQLAFISVICMLVIGGFVFISYVSYRGIMLWRGGDDGGDGGAEMKAQAAMAGLEE